MELRHLRYFVAVATEKSFRRAAERLHISQPPLSMQIKRFEGELGLALFERTSRSVRLSLAGENLLPLATSILDAADRLKTAAKQSAEGAIGVLTIGYLLSSLGPLLAEAMRTFHAAHPNVEVSLVEQRAPQQIEAILNGSLDLALTHGKVEQSELTAEVFSETDVAIALNRGHRLTRKARITLESLQGERLVLLRHELTYGFYDPFFAACAAANVTLPVFQYTNDFVTKLWLVSAGFGVSPTMLPSSLHFTINDVVFRPLATHLPKSPLYLVHRKANMSPLLRIFVDHVRQARAKK